MDKKQLEELRELVIAETFDGDEEAYKRESKRQKTRSFKWQDLLASSEVLPQHERSAHVLIDEVLGYLPPRYITLPYEPFLRVLLDQSVTTDMTDDEFIAKCSEYIIPMRNKDLDAHGHLMFPKESFKKYVRAPDSLRKKAKNRLTFFLGYEPEGAASMTAELLIQSALSDESYPMPDRLTDTDLHAITIIKYREVLLDHGIEAANQSPLFARLMRAAYGIDHFVTGFYLPDCHR